jgi:hypothetical protein
MENAVEPAFFMSTSAATSDTRSHQMVQGQKPLLSSAPRPHDCLHDCRPDC